MTQPKFAPIQIDDEVRPAEKLDVPRPWVPHRPSERRPGPLQAGRVQGNPGPDQGYALGLADGLAPRVVLGDHEHLEDALAAAVSIGLRRASIFGRAPVQKDLEFALSALGFLAPLPADKAELRRSLIGGTAHDYLRQRELADLCTAEELRASSNTKGTFLLERSIAASS